MGTEEWGRWWRKYKGALAEMEGREQKVEECLGMLEQDMELLGITGVEGK